MIATANIAWLAGLIEGEGSFLWSKTPCISMEMVDKDTIERAAALMGVKVRGPYHPRGGTKPTWSCSAHGPRAIGWMLTLFTFMGARRREAIEKVIKRWLEAPGYPKASRGRRLPALCHPDRNRVGDGRCRECYMRDYRAAHKGDSQ